MNITEEQVVAWMRERMEISDPIAGINAITLSVHRGKHVAWFLHGNYEACEISHISSTACENELKEKIPSQSQYLEARARKAAELRAEADRLEASV